MDGSLSPLEKVLAFLIPAAIQGYVGNVLEPQLFGAGRPISLLLASYWLRTADMGWSVGLS